MHTIPIELDVYHRMFWENDMHMIYAVKMERKPDKDKEF